jgi:hypothetical protein
MIGQQAIFHLKGNVGTNGTVSCYFPLSLPNITLNTLFSNTLKLRPSLHRRHQSSHPYKTRQSITFLHIFFVIWKEVTKGQAQCVNHTVTDFFSKFPFNLLCSHSKQIQLKCAVRRIISITHFTVVIPDACTLQVRFFQPVFKCQAYAAENGKEKEPPTPEWN